MSGADELDKRGATLAGCTLAAFGDLDARIVLCASTAERRPQEDLDALCQSASAALDGVFSGPVARALGAARLNQAVTITPGEINVFLRSDNEPTDALFCTFADQTDIADMVAVGRAALKRIVQVA